MADRKDPFLAFCFKVTIDGCGAAFFKSVSGLESETEVVPYRAGGVNDTTFQLVGAVKWKNLVFKRGFCDHDMAKWRAGWVTGGKPGERRGGTIVQMSPSGQPVATWTFVRGWPCKWTVSELDASKSEVSIETLEIAHEGLKCA